MCLDICLKSVGFIPYLKQTIHNIQDSAACPNEVWWFSQRKWYCSSCLKMAEFNSKLYRTPGSFSSLLLYSMTFEVKPLRSEKSSYALRTQIQFYLEVWIETFITRGKGQTLLTQLLNISEWLRNLRKCRETARGGRQGTLALLLALLYTCSACVGLQVRLETCLWFSFHMSYLPIWPQKMTLTLCWCTLERNVHTKAAAE